MKYQIRYEPLGGDYRYTIYQRIFFGFWVFHERWNSSENAVRRIRELRDSPEEHFNITKRMELFHKFDEGEICNGMAEYSGKLYVSTNCGVYEITEAGLKELE